MNKLLVLCILLTVGLSACDGTNTRLTANTGSAADEAAGGGNPPEGNDDSDPDGDTPPADGDSDGDDTDGGDAGSPDTGGSDPDSGGNDTGGDAGGGDGGGESPDDGTAGTGGLLGCLNPDFAVVGTRQLLSYRSSSGSGSLEFTTDILVSRETTFNGIPVLEAVTEEQGATSSSTSQLYALDPVSGIQRNYQVISEAQSPVGNITTVIGFDPFWEIRFDLDPGESNTSEYTVTTETEIPSSPFPAPATESQVTRTRTYTGRESITVPAGTFATCRVEEIVTGNGGGDENNVFWFGVGSGVLIRQMASAGGGDATTTELLDGSVNGSDL